jgi:uncharacterized protein YceH (UPF0502 family)
VEKELPILNEAEQRVLGSLMEKSKTTPDYYPMTLNSITAACNQKSSRHPVVNYSEETVLNALNSLKAQSLVSTAVGGGSRVLKYKHNFTTVYPLKDAELAIICLLLLRGAMTPGEINSNSARLHEFSSLESVLENLNSLSSRTIPFVKMGGRKPGQKETRYLHLLGTVDEHMEEATEEILLPKKNGLEERVLTLENEVARLKEIIDSLTK